MVMYFDLRFYLEIVDSLIDPFIKFGNFLGAISLDNKLSKWTIVQERDNQL